MYAISMLPLLLVTPIVTGESRRRLRTRTRSWRATRKTGEMGVAVQSHYFSVGPVVPWAEAGVGAVATQSLVPIDYGPERSRS